MFFSGDIRKFSQIRSDQAETDLLRQVQNADGGQDGFQQPGFPAPLISGDQDRSRFWIV